MCHVLHSSGSFVLSEKSLGVSRLTQFYFCQIKKNCWRTKNVVKCAPRRAFDELNVNGNNCKNTEIITHRLLLKVVISPMAFVFSFSFFSVCFESLLLWCCWVNLYLLFFYFLCCCSYCCCCIQTAYLVSFHSICMTISPYVCMCMVGRLYWHKQRKAGG